MSAIGGYFELELCKGEHYHQEALRLNTARNCFEYILRAKQYVKVYLPYYTCEVMFQPLIKLNIEYELYHIDEIFEITHLPNLKENECILYTNYFALKQNYVKYLSTVYGCQLIVDNSQAFFAKPISHVDTFYSARKFFGVPDGAYLYTDGAVDLVLEKDKSYTRMQHLLQRIDEGPESAYASFRENDNFLDYQPIKVMSELTDRLLSNICYESIRQKRIDNYNFLSAKLFRKNKLKIEMIHDEVPMVYPFLSDNDSLREKLIANRIFVATYWPSILKNRFCNSIEYLFARNLLAIPIDQRYDANILEKIIDVIA